MRRHILGAEVLQTFSASKAGSHSYKERPPARHHWQTRLPFATGLCDITNSSNDTSLCYWTFLEHYHLNRTSGKAGTYSSNCVWPLTLSDVCHTVDYSADSKKKYTLNHNLLYHCSFCHQSQPYPQPHFSLHSLLLPNSYQDLLNIALALCQVLISRFRDHCKPHTDHDPHSRMTEKQKPWCVIISNTLHFKNHPFITM